VVDLFAGTGAMGVEALSRGAERCTFVEQSRAAQALITTNLERAGVADRATIERADATSWRGSADLVIADPPYAFDGWTELLTGLDTTWLVAESDRPVDVGASWTNVRHKTYGGTVVTLARRHPSPSPGDLG
jgi:16S rRNA (guanine966-N2)-methyltransferase